MVIDQRQLSLNLQLPVSRIRALAFPAVWLRRRHPLSPQRASLIAELVGFHMEASR